MPAGREKAAGGGGQWDTELPPGSTRTSNAAAPTPGTPLAQHPPSGVPGSAFATTAAQQQQQQLSTSASVQLPPTAAAAAATAPSPAQPRPKRWSADPPTAAPPPHDQAPASASTSANGAAAATTAPAAAPPPPSPSPTAAVPVVLGAQPAFHQHAPARVIVRSSADGSLLPLASQQLLATPDTAHVGSGVPLLSPAASTAGAAQPAFFSAGTPLSSSPPTASGRLGPADGGGGALGLLSSQRSGRLPPASHDKAPAPAYPASVLFRYPPDAAPVLKDEQVAGLCFPNQVRMERAR